MTRLNAQERKQIVIDQLTWDSNVNAANISVDVIDDNVILEGTVSTYGQKLAAQRTLQAIPGLRIINNNLEIKHVKRSDNFPDDKIDYMLKKKLNELSFPAAEKIKISIDNGVITLEGKLESLQQKDQLTQQALETNGVVDIINRCYVQPITEQTDEEIVENIRTKMMEKALIDEDQIFVEVNNGEVYLRGNAPSWRVKEDIHEIAYNTRSVTDVLDDIKVDQLPIDNEYRE